MKFEIEGEKESVVRFSLKMTSSGDIHLLVNGDSVLAIDSIGGSVMVLSRDNPSALPVDSEDRLIIEGYTRDE